MIYLLDNVAVDLEWELPSVGAAKISTHDVKSYNNPTQLSL